MKTGPRPKPIEERFWKRVNKTETCWLWTGAKLQKGYGRLWLERTRKVESAHRVSWEIKYGPVPESLCVLHRCDVPSCVRPDHLFLGTMIDNMRDAEVKDRVFRQKLTSEQAARIKALVKSGEKLSRIAARFGVSDVLIGFIKRGTIWRNA